MEPWETRKTRLTLEQLMAIDFEAEAEKVRPCCWSEAMIAKAVKQAASAKSILRSRPMSSEERRYYRHVMEEGVVALEHFKEATCPRCGKRLPSSVPSYYRRTLKSACAETREALPLSKMWVAMIMRNAEHAQTILDEWGWTKWLP